MSDQTQGQGIDENGADAYAMMQRAGAPAAPSAPAQDNSGAAPVMPVTGGIAADNSGVPNIPPPNMGPTQSDAVGGINQEGQNQVAQSAGLVGASPGGAQGEADPQKRIASMVMGEGAAPIQTLREAAKGVDPHNTQPPGNQNMMAIDAAWQKGDQKGAIALMQGNRVAFGSQQAFAYQALNGAEGKPPDLNAAINAANQAEQHVLDGSNVKFSHAGNSRVTATVTTGANQKPQTIDLSVDQFKQFLNVGDSHWDKLMDTTIPATLQQIASSKTSTALSSMPAPKAQAQPGATAAPEGETGDDEGDNAPAPSKAVQTGKAQARDVTQGDQPAQPGQFDKAGHYIGKPVKSFSDQQAEADPQGYGAELEKRSRQIFPDVGHEAQRQQWMEVQEEKELERGSKFNVEVQKGKNLTDEWALRNQGGQKREEIKAQGGVDKAGVYAGARMYSADRAGEAQKAKAMAALDAAAKREAGIQGRSNQRNSASLLRQELANEAITPLSPEHKAAIEAIVGGGAAPQAPSGQPAPPPTGQAQRPPGVPPGAKNFNGKWYTRGPNGESVPVQ